MTPREHERHVGLEMTTQEALIAHLRQRGTLERITATFEQHCEGGPGLVRGCVHIEN